jgi:catalase
MKGEGIMGKKEVFTMKDNGRKPTTTDTGIPAYSGEYSLTVGPDRPTLIQDYYLIG